MRRKLDLRTGRPVWTAYRAPKVPVEALRRDMACDALVIGMGVSGALIAEALTGAGLSVIAIDRRGPLLGSTAATTALVQFEVDQPLTKLVPRIGRDAAERAWQRSRLAVTNLAGRIDRLGIACNASLRPSLLLAGDVLDPAGLETEALARRSVGIGAEFLPRKVLKAEFGFARDGAILSTGNIQLDPRKLSAGMLNLARQRGATFFAPVEATALEHDAGGVTVATKNGPAIRAGHVVLATGYELMDIVPKVPHSVVSTWALATVRQKHTPWPREAFVWEASDPYLYARVTHDGRIVCGGEDEEFTDEEARDALIGEKTSAILAKLKKLVPDADMRAEFAWTGSFGTTPTGLPYVGAIPRHPRIFAAMGYGGNGITFSQMASELILNAIEGREDRDAALFSLSR
ncbi:MAG: FAD-binding oxidoreductase [Rhizobiaceae bacterium]|nr:FAD-binding oxidoreductase [Rhizobiaceae bacterium]